MQGEALFSYGGLTVGGWVGIALAILLTGFVALSTWTVLRRVGFSGRRAALRLVLLVIPVVQLAVLAELAWAPWPSEEAA